jgi:thiol-disulfide isomerase/thioredoxin
VRNTHDGEGLSLKKSAIIVISFLLLASIQLGSSNAHSETLTYEMKEVIQSSMLNLSQSGTIHQTDKVVLIEMYTATWCAFCATVEPVVDILSKEYGSDLAVLEYHPYPNTDGEIFGFSAGSKRMASYYDTDQFPTTVFDGIIKNIGIAGSESDIYSTFKTYIDQRMKKEPKVGIRLQGGLNGGSGWVNATFETEGYFSINPSARVVVFEDDIYYDYLGSNGITNHRFVVRDILLNQEIAINATSRYNFNDSFQLDPEWNTSKLGVVAFAQSDSKTRYASSLGGLDPHDEQIGIWVVVILACILLLISVIIAILRRKKRTSVNLPRRDEEDD